MLGKRTMTSTGSRRLRLGWLVLLPLLLSAVAGYWRHNVLQHRQQVAHEFQQSVAHAGQMIVERFSFYETLLFAGRALFSSSEDVTAGEWSHFVEAMQVREGFPGIMYLAFSRYRPGAEAGGRAMILTHIEPAMPFRHMIGQDLAQTPAILEASERACEAQGAVFSQVVRGLPHQMPVLYQLLPVFRLQMPLASEAQRHAALLGWVTVAYDLHNWLSQLSTYLESDHYALELYEKGTGSDQRQIFSNSAMRRAGDSPLVVQSMLPLAGTEWILQFISSAEFDEGHHGTSHHLVGFSMLVTVFTLWAFVYWLLGGRERAVQQAELLHLRLRRSEQRYRQLFEGNKAVQLLIDPQDGSIVDANEAAGNYYGYGRAELQRMHISDINTLSPEEIALEMASACEGRRNHFYFKHRHATGEVRDVEVHSGPVEVEENTLLFFIVHDVTARMQSEQALRESEARYHTIIDTTAEGYWLIDLEPLRIVDVNVSLCDMLGYSREELIGHQLFEFVDEENRQVLLHQVEKIYSEEQRQYEVVLRHKDGHGVPVAVYATNMPIEQGRPQQAFALVSDISERRRTEEQLRTAATFFDTTSEAITVTDSNNRIVAVNPAFCNITGYSAEEVLGQDPSILSSGRNSPAFYRNMWHTLQRMGRWQGEIWNRRKSGEVFPEWLSIVAIKDHEGITRQHMAVFSDITKRKQDEEKIWRQANYDALTSLPNRNLFKDRLDQAIHAAHREGWQLALLFIDLDRFKWVNDTLGHGAGDLLLQQTAKRLSACVREMDTVARLGGDEFTMILTDINDMEDIERIANKVIDTLAAAFDLDGREAFISGSLGIAHYPHDADNMEALLRCADSAMYSAKAAGRNGYRFYSGEVNEASQRRLQLEADLRRVLEREELLLHYQPIVNSSGTIAGAEALLRWHHPQLGLVPPDEFIPLAEELGIVVEIERWVMRRACLDTRSWHALTGSDFFIAVNVSSVQCQSDVCRRTLHGILTESGLPASQLKLEITERVMMENTDFVIGLLNEVKALGVRLAVDDFGTGYSSLSYLKQFPIDVLKIDRAFISGLPDDREDVALVEAILAMAHSLNLQVVAEGVETAAQLEFLREHGCDLIQGFYYSRPLPEEAFRHYLGEHMPV
jgi:diguanylate cyclase (GGDEF)-like protein/PAS domain S-box-containing protein